MRVPLAWLYDYVRPSLDARELADRLAMTGTEVERIEHYGVSELDAFVVGRVLDAQPHPDADRLSVCKVAIGEGDVSEIVCGAPNVAAGQTVAVAQPGAVMPDGTKLKKAKLRGVVSNGMILAEDEVAIGIDHDGIMVLDDELLPGTPLLDVLPISTDVLELEVTPNRPDCLGVYGVAREVHAATGAPLAPPPWTEDPGTTEGPPPPGIEIDVQAPDLCPRFTARVYENVTVGPSPAWLKARLMAAGQRPINNVVDITNYVMLLTGHPLHAFDLDRVAGARLTIRRARDGEKMTTLDDVERTLDPDVCVIEDAEGPTSIAGIMGGARSEVHPDTSRVLMEVATWDGPNINRTSWKLALRTEASTRFEKGLPPEGTLEAQAIAAQLMIELCGATLLPGTVDVGGPGPAPQVIRLRERRVQQILGAPVPRERQAEILTSLGFGVTEADDGLDVAVPHFRRLDITREADLVEEVARIDGVDRLPATLPSRRGATGLLTHAQKLRRRSEDALAGRGLLEIAGWSFTDPGLPDRLRLPEGDPLRRMVVLENPLSEAQSVLRPTLLGSLLDAAGHNVARGVTDLGLFESGTVYRQGDGPLADEHHALGAILTGDALRSAGWRDGRRKPADIFTAKAVLANLLDTLRVGWSVEPGGAPFLHPGRSAGVLVAGEKVGWLGEVHPLVAREWELDQAVAAFEVDLGRVVSHAPEVVEYRDLTSFPAVRQDIAVVVGDDVPAARVVELVRRAGGRLVERVEVFDVYAGEQLGEGRRSLALHLELRAPDRTLTDDDVAPVRERIVRALADELGGELRG